MNQNLYILGEESPSHEILTVISWFMNQPLIVDESKVLYQNVTIDNNLFFEVVGSGIQKYDKIYYGMVSSAGNSFVDYMFFEGDILPEPDSKPLAALEATKNDARGSGNMSDQRSPKMIALREKYGSDFRCGYLIRNEKSIEDNIALFTQSHNCAFASMNAIGVEIIVSQYGNSAWKEHEVPFKYNCIENIIIAENSKRKASGVPSRVFQTADNEFNIQVKLRKGNTNATHDPGEGYLASRSYVIRKLCPNATINVTEHQRDSKYFTRTDNKLINVLKFVGATAVMNDDNIVIERNENVFNKPYWKYTSAGEKNATIVLEQFFIGKGLEIIFTNHAGCGKSDIKLGDKYFATKKTKGIPDLVAFDRDNNTLIVVEGETSKNYHKGMIQVQTPEFDSFIQTEFVSRIGNDLKVKKYLCTFGKYNQEPEVLFNLTEDYKITYNENAVEVK